MTYTNVWLSGQQTQPGPSTGSEDQVFVVTEDCQVVINWDRVLGALSFRENQELFFVSPGISFVG
jgi:hypothetical protein